MRCLVRTHEKSFDRPFGKMDQEDVMTVAVEVFSCLSSLQIVLCPLTTLSSTVQRKCMLVLVERFGKRASIDPRRQ